MFRCLSPGAIGINAELGESLLLARKGEFDGLDVSIGEIARRATDNSMGDVKQLFRDAGVRPGGWGLPVRWRGEQEEFEADLAALPNLATVAQELGSPWTTIWIMPCSDDLPFDANFAYHQERLSPVAKILKEHGCRLGLEFIGPATIRRGRLHEFIYDVPGMLKLAAACGPNVGLLLDCWHWYTSGGTVDELRTLSAEQVVYVHVNDAPAGVDRDEQIDNVRCMPGETGVIDIGGFLKALEAIGYDGPVTPEPFSQKLKGLSPDEAVRLTGESMQKIWREAELAV